MADEKQSGGGSNFIVLAAAVVSAAYFVLQQPHLQGFRPVETLAQAHDDRGRQDVEARLWQDPFAAVREQYEWRKQNRNAGGGHSIDRAAKDLKNSRVIGVMLPGGPYSTDSEARRRYRYAVLAALHTANYDPIDENHLGYFQTTPHQPQRIVQVLDGNADRELKVEVKLSGGKEKQSQVPGFIPFEQFTNRHNKGNDKDKVENISLLWLNEDVFDADHTPIASIRSFL
jgi:hypothetical protein